jgi:nicotinate-nucleotide--dimethylbenzimidazole phosphoribosyltransferase
MSVFMNLKIFLQQKIDRKTKPTGALGDLETLALQVGLAFNSLTPILKNPSIIVFAGDHGLAHAGVSAYPQAVTPQMVLNFLSGGAAINVFCKQNKLDLTIVDAGVNYDFAGIHGLINAKIGYGTKNCLLEAAMTQEEIQACKEKATEIIDNLANNGSNIVGFGEMGIGNTSSAALIMQALTGIDLSLCIGRGTGVDDAGLLKKRDILQKVRDFHGDIATPEAALMTFGGFEIAMMAYAFIHAKKRGMMVMVDGFIAGAAYLAAFKLDPSIKENAIFCHLSQESGHQLLLDYLEAKPLLTLNMRLGEGTGCALAYPLIQNAVAFLADMASFESAGVSDKEGD